MGLLPRMGDGPSVLEGIKELGARMVINMRRMETRINLNSEDSIFWKFKE
jgi:hypothetical protein